jgi:hypothetical protein
VTDRSNSLIEFVVYTKDPGAGPLSKVITLVDGKPKSDGSHCRMSRGEAERRLVAGVAELGALIEKLTARQALGYGALRADLSASVRIVSKAKLAETAGAVARTSEYVRSDDDAPAFLLLDYDVKDVTPEVGARVAGRGGFWAAMVDVFPDLASAARLVRRSTSSGLYVERDDKTRDVFPGSDGLHVTLEAANGGDSERALKAAHDRLWLKGFGWSIVGRAGQILERSIIDRSVGRPERLVFEGGPVVKLPLRQDAASRRPEACRGARIDTAAIFKPLSASERHEVARRKAEEEKRLAPEKRRRRAEFIADEARKLVARRPGTSLAAAKVAIEKQTSGILTSNIQLIFDDDEIHTVAEVLDAPEAFEGRNLADPLEGVDYGARPPSSTSTRAARRGFTPSRTAARSIT